MLTAEFCNEWRKEGDDFRIKANGYGRTSASGFLSRMLLRTTTL